MSRVSSRMADSRSRGGRVPHLSVSSLIFLPSTWPGPLLVATLESCIGLDGWLVLPGLLPGLLHLPPGQLPPLQLQSLSFWFSSSLMISSRRATTSFCNFWVFLPP